jgi:hypothetical protein
VCWRGPSGTGHANSTGCRGVGLQHPPDTSRDGTPARGSYPFGSAYLSQAVPSLSRSNSGR